MIPHAPCVSEPSDPQRAECQTQSRRYCPSNGHAAACPISMILSRCLQQSPVSVAFPPPVCHISCLVVFPLGCIFLLSVHYAICVNACAECFWMNCRYTWAGWATHIPACCRAAATVFSHVLAFISFPLICS